MTNDLIEWLQSWYGGQADGEWEHDFRIAITTIDNPGWRVCIGLTGTLLAERYFKEVKNYLTDDDWVRLWVEDEKFNGAGDPDKLLYILQEFRNWATSHLD